MATVIFKPTESCNANCIYCMARKSRRGSRVMPLKTLELLFVRIDEFLAERPKEQLELIWHGGEPFLLGRKYFEAALAFQNQHCARTKGRIRHTLQSNLTLFRREFVGVLRELGILTLGTSYDPVIGLRGLGADRDSVAYNQSFMKGLRIVQEEGFDWGVVYVVTKRSLADPVSILQFLVNLGPTRGLIFNPVIAYDSALDVLGVTPLEYAKFLEVVFPVWWRHRDEWPAVEPFNCLVDNLQHRRKALICVDSGQCADTHVSLLPDGTLSHCGRSADTGLLHYGRIEEKSLSSVFLDPQRDFLRQRNLVLRKTECHDCRFWAVCHGGCPLET